MTKKLNRLIATLIGSFLLFTTSTYAMETNNMTIIKFTTNQGEITLELDAEKAPNTVANFVSYVEDG
ncbi:MAG: peptidylprolyl isomerase, partial [Cycloclasticus sp.]